MEKIKRKVIVNYEPNRFGNNNLLSTYKLLLSEFKQSKKTIKTDKKVNKEEKREEVL